MIKCLKTMIKTVAVLAALFHASNCWAAPVHVSSPEAGVNLTTEKIAHITGVIDYTTSRQFLTEMEDTSFLPGDRLILINSGGGNVEEAFKMIAAVKQEKRQGTRIVCLVRHEASSMAFNILTLCDVRLSDEHAHFMVHKVAYEFLDGTSPPRLTAKMLRRQADELDKEDRPMQEANQKAMGLSEADYNTFADNETIWIAPVLRAKHYLQGYSHN